MVLNITEKQIKLVLIGDGGVGKTTFIKRLLTGEFEEKYIATIGCQVIKFKLFTNIGQVNLEIWDIAGREEYGMLRDGYYIGADAAIIMFDVTSRMTYKNVPTWYKDFVRVVDHQPVVLCGNKIDDKEYRVVKPNQILFHRRKNIQYYDLSVSTNYNPGNPLLYLIKTLSGNQSISFIGESEHLTPTTPIETLFDEISISEKEEINNANLENNAFKVFSFGQQQQPQLQVEEEQQVKVIPLTFFDTNLLNKDFSFSGGGEK